MQRCPIGSGWKTRWPYLIRSLSCPIKRGTSAFSAASAQFDYVSLPDSVIFDVAKGVLRSLLPIHVGPR